MFVCTFTYLIEHPPSSPPSPAEVIVQTAREVYVVLFFGAATQKEMDQNNIKRNETKVKTCLGFYVLLPAVYICRCMCSLYILYA